MPIGPATSVLNRGESPHPRHACSLTTPLATSPCPLEVLEPSKPQGMSLANFNSTFPNFEMRHPAAFSFEATYDACGASSTSNAVFWPCSRQTPYSKHKLSRDLFRRGLIHATGKGVLQSPRENQLAFRGTYGWPFWRLGCVLALTANAALAQQDPAECIRAHAKAQELESTGKLIQALKEFEACATNGCPKLIQKDCNVLGRAVEQAIPTLSLTALDHTGQPLSKYRIELDGVSLLPEIARQPIPVDPGERHVKVVVPGRPPTFVTVPVRSDRKHQNTIIQLPAPDPVVSGTRTASYVLTAMSVVGLVSFVGFGVSGYLDQHELESKSNISTERNDLRLADQMRQKYVIADVSLGISLVSLGAATYLWFVAQDAEKPPAYAKTAVYLNGSTNGGTVFVRGTF